MNHRYSDRECLHVRLKLYLLGRYLGQYKTRDINPDGAFILSKKLALKPFDLIEIRFRKGFHKFKTLPKKGLVIRHTDDGVGLMFN